MNFYQQKYFKPYHQIATTLPKYTPTHKYDTGSQQDYDTYKEMQGLRNNQSKYVGFERSPLKHIHAQKIIEPIWEHLYHQGMKSQKQLMQKHNNNKNKIDFECTFKPLIKQNKRYLAASSSTFLQRVNIWQENKVEKIIRQKQQEVNKDLKECTFVPQINNNIRKVQNIDGNNRSQIKPSHKKTNINPYYSPIKLTKEISKIGLSPIKKNTSKVQLNFAKNMIRSQLKRLAI